MRSLMVLLFVAAACSQVPTSSNEATVEKPTTTTTSSSEITIIGKLTTEGVECRAMRADGSNELYTLTGNVAGFKPGDHVKVVGKVAEISFCMQGTTIAVSSITRV